MSTYTLKEYYKDIDNLGLEKTWIKILDSCDGQSVENYRVNIAYFGELYEIGLAYLNKESKKKSGVYYTPSDVSQLLADYFKDLKGENICDVCCGTGNLILAYLSKFSKSEVIEMLKNKKIYLYDLDSIALMICKRTIGLLYGKEYVDYLNCFVGDFLDKDVHLPNNCKVISNPPYFKIEDIKDNWEQTEILLNTKEYFSVFMEKIIKESKSSVIISPFTFIGGDKFYCVREFLNKYNGCIFSFDNVPGNIFKGRKHGVFNTNVVNSVRAAITVVENKEGIKGFQISPLIRFSTEERERILKRENLDKFRGIEYQIVDGNNDRYYKCFKDILNIFNVWRNCSSSTLGALLSKYKTEYKLVTSKTSRYFISASKKDLNRAGKVELYFNDEESMKYAYCMLNSSFMYLYWRIYEGAITISDKLLKSLPIFMSKLTEKDKEEIDKIYNEMAEKEDSFLVYKKNASEVQENVKVPEVYIEKLNQIFFNILGLKEDIHILDKIHSNCIF